jgi:hypothetical protein
MSISATDDLDHRMCKQDHHAHKLYKGTGHHTCAWVSHSSHCCGQHEQYLSTQDPAVVAGLARPNSLLGYAETRGVGLYISLVWAFATAATVTAWCLFRHCQRDRKYCKIWMAKKDFKRRVCGVDWKLLGLRGVFAALLDSSPGALEAPAPKRVPILNLMTTWLWRTQDVPLSSCANSSVHDGMA